MARIGTILVATDFSGVANAAVKRAARLAHALKADLHLACVVEEVLLERLREMLPPGRPDAESPAVAVT